MCGFFAPLRNDGDFCTAFLQIEHRIRRVSLAKKCLLWLQLDDGSAQPGVGKKGRGIELGDSFTFQNVAPDSVRSFGGLFTPLKASPRCGVPEVCGEWTEEPRVRLGDNLPSDDPRNYEQSLSIIARIQESCMVNFAHLEKCAGSPERVSAAKLGPAFLYHQSVECPAGVFPLASGLAERRSRRGHCTSFTTFSAIDPKTSGCQPEMPCVEITTMSICSRSTTSMMFAGDVISNFDSWKLTSLPWPQELHGISPDAAPQMILHLEGIWLRERSQEVLRWETSGSRSQDESSA